jgi:hypothetical protein
MADQTQMSFITTFTRVMPAEKGLDRRMSRCVGYLADKEQAISAVKANAGDINEAGSYPLALVETLSEGIYPDTISTVWFEWDSTLDGYREIPERPEDLQGQCGFSLG